MSLSEQLFLNWVMESHDIAIQQQTCKALETLGLGVGRVLQPQAAWQLTLPAGDNWRDKLDAVWKGLPVDWLLLPKNWRPKLAVFDMDSTLITMEVIDELAALVNAKEQVAAITMAAMRGEIDFKTSFIERMRYLARVPQSSLSQVVDKMQLMPGSLQLLSWLQSVNCRTAIISGGFDYFARIVQQRLSIDAVVANQLEIEEGFLTGRVLGQIVDAEYKLQSLKKLAQTYDVALADVLVIGDGANDLPMLNAVGIGLAFHAKPKVQQLAPWSVRFISMDKIVHLLAGD